MLEKHIRLFDFTDLSGKDLAIGFFDGLHVGHRLLLSECRKDGTRPSLLTFDAEEMLSFRKDGKLIYTAEEREILFSSCDLDCVYVLPFDEETRNASKEAFLLFLEKCHPQRIVVGEDFTFGKNALGKATDIASFLTDIPVSIIPLGHDWKGKISSSRIKETLRQGQIEEANLLLGSNFFCVGKVLHGKNNGHRIGFPTANLLLDERKVYPPSGVYKTRTTIDGKAYPSMTNIGTHPTIDEIASHCMETHVLNWMGNLYGKAIRVEFLSRIRDQMKFDSIDALRNQLLLDAKTCLA